MTQLTDLARNTDQKVDRHEDLLEKILSKVGVTSSSVVKSEVLQPSGLWFESPLGCSFMSCSTFIVVGSNLPKAVISCYLKTASYMKSVYF